ncbi:hypothetical protein BTVI_152186 [Pitangus sulphuratus]|nr:hypothetical protein BTVI_152186 [Pitangus sulphuratus]
MLLTVGEWQCGGGSHSPEVEKPPREAGRPGMTHFSESPCECRLECRDLDKLEKWAHGSLMSFSTVKCKVLHLDQGNLQLQYNLGDEGIKGSTVKKDLGVLVDERLGMTWVAKKASGVLACVRNIVASRTRAVIVLLYRALVRPHLKSYVHDQKGIEGLERVQRRAMELGKGLEHKSGEEQLRELGRLSLKKRSLRGDLIALYNHLTGHCSQVGIRLFSQTIMARTILLGELQPKLNETTITLRHDSLGVVLELALQNTLPFSYVRFNAAVKPKPEKIRHVNCSLQQYQ